MANHRIEEIEGIGPTHGQKLVAAGVTDTDALLAAGKTAAGRQRLADATDIRRESILTWVNHADLFRITGVGPEFAELLEAAGVDTVRELSHRVAANLAAKLDEVNAARKLTRRVPNEDVLSKWVAEAKTLPAMVEH